MKEDNSTYNKELLIAESLSKDSEALVLIFSAEWISQSSIVDIVSQKLRDARSDINVIQLDADADEDLFVKYRVSTLPSAIIIKNHQVIKKITGTFSKMHVIKAIG